MANVEGEAFIIFYFQGMFRQGHFNLSSQQGPPLGRLFRYMNLGPIKPLYFLCTVFIGV